MYKLLLVLSLLFTMPIFACDKKTSLHTLEGYIWLTEDYPPYNFFDEHGKMSGISVDILELVFQELNLVLKREDIRLIPWARLVRELKLSKKFAAFTMVYTEKRAEQYSLVSTLLPTTISVMVLDEKINELRNKPIKELSVAVVREDIGLVSLNLKNYDSKRILTTSHHSMVNMLYRYRADAIAFNEELIRFLYNKNASPQHTIKTLYVLQENLVNSYVFHKDTDKCITELFSQTLKKITQDGTLKKIRKQYLPEN
jgi:ABC-type amino acid transport substrate-binding protein